MCLTLLFLLFKVVLTSAHLKMTKDPNKPRGKTSAYAFFVATCREEHKKKHPGTSVNFAEFSKKCSERWKVSHLQVLGSLPAGGGASSNLLSVFKDHVGQGEGEV